MTSMWTAWPAGARDAAAGRRRQCSRQRNTLYGQDAQRGLSLRLLIRSERPPLPDVVR